MAYSLDPVATDLPEYGYALLNAIAGPESAGKYNIRYTPNGGATFDLNGQHPGIMENGPYGKSSASGRYQFTRTTWDSLPAEAKGDGTFSPENQDRAALYLANQRFKQATGSDLGEHIKANGFDQTVISALAPTWHGFKDNPQKSIKAYNETLERRANGGASPADIPAAGASVAEGKAAPAAGVQNSAIGKGFQPPAPEPTIWEKLKAGGPGALFGSPQNGWNFADAISGASVAMLARDKPEAALAMAKALGMDKQKSAANLQMGNFNKETGRATLFNPQSGQVVEKQVAQGTGKELTEKARQTIYDRDNNASIVADTTERAHYFREKIVNGELDVSIFATAETRAKAMANMSPEKARVAVEYEQFIKNAANTALQLNKGVQTDKDYDRTLQGIAPDITKYDNKLTLSALNTLVDRGQKEFSNLRRSQESTIKDYGQNAPSGDYVERYKNLGDRLGSLGKDENYVQKSKSYLDSKTGPGGSSPDSTGPRVGPAQAASPAFGRDQAREEMLRNRKATGTQ